MEAVGKLNKGQIEVKISGLDKIKNDMEIMVQTAVAPVESAVQNVQNSVNRNAQILNSVVQFQEAGHSVSDATLDILNDVLEELLTSQIEIEKCKKQIRRMEKKYDYLLGLKSKIKKSKKSKK